MKMSMTFFTEQEIMTLRSIWNHSAPDSQKIPEGIKAGSITKSVVKICCGAGHWQKKQVAQ